MSGWQYDDVGQFGSRQGAEDWAKRNNIDPRDLHVRDQGDGSVDVGVKRGSAKDQYNDGNNDRRDGFF